MSYSITSYKDETTMEPWPALADRAFCLTGFSGKSTLFFYDSPPKEASSKEPVFILIHGLGDEADSFRRLIPHLNSRGFRVLALDLPGFGRSVARGKINVKKHARAVLKLIEAACGGASVFLAGNSMGAVIAEIAAFKKPDLIKGLILIDGSIPGGPKNPGFLALLKLLFCKKWYRAYRSNPEKAWASLYPYYADLDRMPREDRDFLKRRVMARVESPTQERAFFATQRSLVRIMLGATGSYSAKIKKYKGSILLLWGDLDNIIPLSSAEAFEALREDIVLKIIPGAGHLPHQEKPDETARRMADFAEQYFG